MTFVQRILTLFLSSLLFLVSLAYLRQRFKRCAEKTLLGFFYKKLFDKKIERRNEKRLRIRLLL